MVSGVVGVLARCVTPHLKIRHPDKVGGNEVRSEGVHSPGLAGLRHVHARDLGSEPVTVQALAPLVLAPVHDALVFIAS